MNILGISAYYHDSAAAIIQDGKIIAAAQEDRFTRKKADPGFPKHAIEFCLKYSGLELSELDAIVFYDKPLLKFERLLETYYGFAPKGISSFLTSIPVWIKEKIFFKKLLYEELFKIGKFDKRKVKLLFPEHHLSHAASAFFPSPYKEAAILTIDGVGEWATATIGMGKGNQIEILKELRFPHSLGLLYSAFTYYTGFKVNSGEYKVMGLAPYGEPDSANVNKYIKAIKENLIDIKDDGSIWLNQEYFNYATGLRMIKEEKWQKLFGIKTRKEEARIDQQHCDLALAIQKINDEVVLKMAKEAMLLTGVKNLCMAGGTALNCVSNGKLLREKIFDNIFIQPAAGDAGGAIGAALGANYIYFDKERITDEVNDSMNGAYLGPEFSNLDIELTAKKYKAVWKYYDDFNLLAADCAELLTNGNVIGWFQGRMEFGPRSLGNRSIIGDPRNPDMQKKLNLKIKFREGFRPFAPSVLSEDARGFFEIDAVSPYMLLIADIQKKRRKLLPENYSKLSLWDRLYYQRSDLQSITHLDFSARIQTVHKETNERYWKLINEFKKLTGYGVVVNTSFNVRGEPIVCCPEDAYRCFMRTEMDYLVMGNYFFIKTGQPCWDSKDNWKEEFKMD